MRAWFVWEQGCLGMHVMSIHVRIGARLEEGAVVRLDTEIMPVPIECRISPTKQLCYLFNWPCCPSLNGCFTDGMVCLFRHCVFVQFWWFGVTSLTSKLGCLGMHVMSIHVRIGARLQEGTVHRKEMECFCWPIDCRISPMWQRGYYLTKIARKPKSSSSFGGWYLWRYGGIVRSW
jgi:hypothetical protein